MNILTHDYPLEIKNRLSSKADLIKISAICAETGVSRFVITKFVKGEIPTTSYENIIKLYEYLEKHNI